MFLIIYEKSNVKNNDFKIYIQRRRTRYYDVSEVN